MKRGLTGGLFVLPLLAVLLTVVTPAQAAFPGLNGKIAFTSDRDSLNLEVYAMSADGTAQSNLTNDPDSDSEPTWSPNGSRIAFSTFRDANDEIYVMNADGSGQARLTSNTVPDTSPAWSPDGQKIAFTSDRDGSFNLEIYVMNADGSGQSPLTSEPELDTGAAWSPDGQKIAFTSTRDGDADVLVMNADGTNAVSLTANGATDSGADWSPSGAKIAFSSNRDGNAEIYVMNADGTGQTRLTTNSASDFSPAWSPDGSKIAFRSRRDGNWEIYTMNANGTGPTRLTTEAALDTDPDWQPLPITGYPRPKGASPVRISLVPGYSACGAPNATHGPPLAFGSCGPPAQTSSQLTVGTLDANGQAARSIGYARFNVIVGDPGTSADEADVAVAISLTDVRRRSDMSDYTGELEASATIRVTDRFNGPAPTGPATVGDFQFPLTVPCSATADPATGGACVLATTFDALTPGTVVEGMRANWQLGAIEIYDSGADGDVDTGPNTLFARQGVFVP